VSRMHLLSTSVSTRSRHAPVEPQSIYPACARKARLDPDRSPPEEGSPRFEIGYWCRTRYAGQGYITEAVRGITGFALDHLDARRVEIRCDSLNRRSERVAERAGLRLEGELRNAELGADGEPRNTLVFSMLPEERDRSV
jgi:RimJ/RimL family protein N-acetyltransferase